MNYYLAQVNIAKMLAPLDDPIMQDFISSFDAINAIADNSEGFVWRMKDEDREEGAKIFQEDSLVINISVWEDIDSLFHYVYHSGHIDVFKRKKEWFKLIKLQHMAFWYVPKGYEPNFNDAKERLDYIRSHSATPYAFNFKSRFTVQDFLNYKPQRSCS